jgi:prepilin-type processing-associated H-X9-DG protein
MAPPAKTRSSVPVLLIVLGAVVGVGALLLCGGAALMLPAVQAAREAARRAQCASNMQQIAEALSAYHDVHGTFPPAYIPDENGRQKHSWRVLILPHMGRQDVFGQYDFDEPWDGPSNSRLATQMPAEFACPSDPGARSSSTTNYLAVTGPGTMFAGSNGIRRDQIPDGMSNTLMVVEVTGANVNWMEPRDVDITLMTGGVGTPGGKDISSFHPGGAQAAFADGSVHYLPANTPIQTLQGMMTVGGHEPVLPP